MEAIKKLLEARSALEKAASDFLDACATLKLVVTPSLASVPGQLAFESNVDEILSSVDSASLVTDIVLKSCSILKNLLNLSTTRVPISKLPAETLSHIFSIVVASSPCKPSRNQRDTLLEIPRVCTRWNQVVTNTPSLWSHVDIDPSDYFFAVALRRAQIQLKHCRSMPVHLHLYDMSGITQNHGQDILEVIQSRGGRLGSLIVTNIWYNSSVQAFFGSMLSHTMSSSLRTLFIHGVQDGSGQRTIDSLPVTLLSGLTVLDLWDLSSNMHPSVGGIVELLPRCSALHTLRLRFLEFSPDLLQSCQVVSLPQLRFLEILGVNRAAVLSLLSRLNSGGLELDVRLEVEYIGDDGLDSPGQLFLARSNVVSLSINNTTKNTVQRPVTNFASVPHLRVLQTDSMDIARDFARMLETTVDDQLPFQLPYLQCLCLFEWILSPQAISLLGQILGQRKLRHLVFLNCQYPSDSARNVDRDQESDSIPASNDSGVGVYKYQDEMPLSMRDWFSERVGGVVVVEEYDDNGVYHGVDLFVQNLIRLE